MSSPTSRTGHPVFYTRRSTALADEWKASSRITRPSFTPIGPPAIASRQTNSGCSCTVLPMSSFTPSNTSACEAPNGQDPTSTRSSYASSRLEHAFENRPPRFDSTFRHPIRSRISCGRSSTISTLHNVPEDLAQNSDYQQGPGDQSVYTHTQSHHLRPVSAHE